jgi:hypothetical protein
VVERRQLQEVLSELKLKSQGVIETNKELGRLTGADAVITGTIGDLDGVLRVNARMLSTKDASRWGQAQATFFVDEHIKKLTDGNSAARSPAGVRRSSTSGKGQPVTFPFHDDFETYEEEDVTRWGQKAKVRKGADTRKWIVAKDDGKCPIGLDVELPASSYIEFDYHAEAFVPVRTKVLTGMRLIDEAGKTLRLEWVLDAHSGTGGGWNNTLALPGSSIWDDPYGSWGVGPRGQFRAVRKGDTLAFFLLKRSQEEPVLVANVSDYKKFTRFEIDLFRGPRGVSMFSVTSIKVGTMDAQKSGASKGR